MFHPYISVNANTAEPAVANQYHLKRWFEAINVQEFEQSRLR